MQSQFVALADSYTIRGSESEQVLFSLRSGTRYDLTREQFDFLTQLSGQDTLETIINQYDEKSQQVIKKFLTNLQTIGALQFMTEKIFRELPQEVVPDIRLEAVHLENSSRCNLRCVHCYQGDQYPLVENLTFDDIKRVADEMKTIQVQGVSISGGEPFCQINIFDIVRLFEERDIRIISFFTNGILLDKTIVRKILDLKSQPGMFISLDAITPEGMIFRGLKESAGKVALKKILTNIEMLKTNGLRVVVNTVMNIHNISVLEKMYNVIKELGVDSWRIGYPKQTGFFREAKDQFGLPWETMAQASFALLQHHFHESRPFHLQMEYLYREELFKDFQPLSDNAFVCDYEMKRQSCCLKPNGDIVSCAYCTDFPVGNIRQQSLSEIWYSRKMQTVKEVKIKDVKGCQDCSLRKYCATGCRVNAYFLNGDFFHAKDDYACQAVKFFVEKVMPFLKAEGVITSNI
jgi:radical SAM protein with 4Fe4S-binding SPASM domain